MNATLIRFGAYSLQRLKEPSTWSGFVVLLTVFGVNLAPEQREAIGTVGTMLAGFLLTFAREGQNVPSNPTLPTVLKGSMPEPKAPIVQPPPTVEVAIDPRHVEADAEGNLKAPGQP